MKIDIYNVLDNQKLIAWNTTIRQDANSPRDSLGLRSRVASDAIAGRPLVQETDDTKADAGPPLFPQQMLGPLLLLQAAMIARCHQRDATPGIEVWRLRQGAHTVSCELRDDLRHSAGVGVVLIQDGELWMSKRCLTAEGARYIAEAFRKDHRRTGWSE